MLTRIVNISVTSIKATEVAVGRIDMEGEELI